MNKTSVSVLKIIGVIAVMAILWYFRFYVALYLLAFLLVLPGRYWIELSTRKYRYLKIPVSVASVLYLLFIMALLLMFFLLVVPPFVAELNRFDYSKTEAVYLMLSHWNEIINTHLGISIFNSETIITDISKQIVSWFDFSDVLKSVSFIAGAVSNILAAIFIVGFLVYFLLRDQISLRKWLLYFVPAGYNDKIKEIANNSKQLVIAYLKGIVIENLIVFVLLFFLLQFSVLPLKWTVIVALFAALLNVIPYVGPLIGILFGVIIAALNYINLNMAEGFLRVELTVVIIFIIVQLIDNIILQPWLYSSRIKAHPLEVFTVILIAGKLGGIPAMIIALPVYSVLRLIAREFLNHYEIIRQLAH